MKKMKKAWLIRSVAVAAGACNALLGAGGGILLSLAMNWLWEKEGDDALVAKNDASAFGGARLAVGGDRRDILVTAQAAMILGCLLSSLIYVAQGSFDPTDFAVFAIPAALGGALGSILLDKIKPALIARLFAALVIWSGARMILRG